MFMIVWQISWLSHSTIELLHLDQGDFSSMQVSRVSAKPLDVLFMTAIYAVLIAKYAFSFS
jgi:hypothetical protein